MSRRFLLNIPTKILPRMANPLLLADFLTSSYETQNNASKILALHGLYILMVEHNFEYPFFFGKLYSLLTIDLFNAKYKARFFYLIDIFLRSSYVAKTILSVTVKRTERFELRWEKFCFWWSKLFFRHLPANLVASFAKRLARLALLVPQHDQCLIITFISNLIVLHPTIRVMIDRTSTSIQNESFLPNEIDPNKTNALDSSLWEIEVTKKRMRQIECFFFFLFQTLTQHHHPDVAACALTLISLKKTANEREIHSLLEIDYDEVRRSFSHLRRNILHLFFSFLFLQMFDNDVNRRIRSKSKKRNDSSMNECPINFDVSVSFFV